MNIDMFETVPDGSCVPTADQMSCGAQVLLASRHADDAAYLRDYMVINPACARYQNLMDRKMEYDLQKTVGSDKKMCIDKRPAFHNGPWTQQFPNATFDPRFDSWTRAKFATKPKNI